MWQKLVVVLVVIAAAVHVARTLGPQRWRYRRQSTSSGNCGRDGHCGQSASSTSISSDSRRNGSR
jgi:hypothetical protein